MTILHQGGELWRGTSAGIAMRDLFDPPFATFNTVASVQKNKQDLLTFRRCMSDKRKIVRLYANCLITILPFGYLLYLSIMPPGKRILPSA